MNAQLILSVILGSILAYSLIRLIVSILEFLFLVFNDVGCNTFDERERQSLHERERDPDCKDL